MTLQYPLMTKELVFYCKWLSNDVINPSFPLHSLVGILLQGRASLKPLPLPPFPSSLSPFPFPSFLFSLFYIFQGEFVGSFFLFSMVQSIAIVIQCSIVPSKSILKLFQSWQQRSPAAGSCVLLMYHSLVTSLFSAKTCCSRLTLYFSCSQTWDCPFSQMALVPCIGNDIKNQDLLGSLFLECD